MTPRSPAFEALESFRESSPERQNRWSADLGAHQTVYLHPGKLFVSDRPAVVTTILGSCVAVCVWDKHLRIGGINHYLLPNWLGGEVTPRFGDVAIRSLLERLGRYGSRIESMQARVFGGACVIEAFRSQGDSHLGLKNAGIAQSLLGAAGVTVLQTEIGGNHGRKLVFNTEDGSTTCKLL